MRKTSDKLENRKTRFHKPDKKGQQLKMGNNCNYVPHSAVAVKTTMNHSPVNHSAHSVTCTNRHQCVTIENDFSVKFILVYSTLSLEIHAQSKVTVALSIIIIYLDTALCCIDLVQFQTIMNCHTIRFYDYQRLHWFCHLVKKK